MAGITVEELLATILEDGEEVVKEAQVSRLESLRAELEAELAGRMENAKKVSAYEKQLRKEIAEEEAKQREQQIREEAEQQEDIRKQLAAKQELEERDREQERNKALTSAVTNAIDKLYTSISTSAKEYSQYVDRIQVRLVGANETFGSITNKLDTVFGASPIFSMKSVLEKVAIAVEKGINFNVESRVAMQVLSDKVAATFDAFDASLLRLVKIQQEDTTKARLGMESVLTTFLNNQFQDSSYLTDRISSNVTASLLEATSLYDAEKSMSLEYSVQKWLGSFYSLGVSSGLVQNIATAVGNLASGDIAALTGNTSMMNLLALASTKGGADFGSLITGDVDAKSIDAIFSGLVSLISEISKADNKVAITEYAKNFGIALSDLQALRNIGENTIVALTEEVHTLESLNAQVEKEASFSNLIKRTGGASIGENLYDNFLYSTGRNIGANAGTYLAWQVGDLVAGALQGITTQVAPWGMGVSLTPAEIVKAGMLTAGTLGGVLRLVTNAGSIGGANLGALEDEKSSIVRGSLLTVAKPGTVETGVSYTGDYSDGAMAAMSGAQTEKAIEMHTDSTYTEEKERAERLQKTNEELNDNVKIIRDLLDKHGILIRGVSTLLSRPSNFFTDELLGNNGASAASSLDANIFKLIGG